MDIHTFALNLAAQRVVRGNAPRRGEVWLVDLGYVAKVRPALVVSMPFGDKDRALITVVPHTTALRGSAFEINVLVHFLKPGAFMVQGVTTIPPKKALRRLGHLNQEEFHKVFQGLMGWLGVVGKKGEGLGMLLPRSSP